MTKQRLLLIIFLAIGLLACRKQASEQEQKSYTMSGDTVYIQDSILLNKIVTGEVSLEPYEKEIMTAGTVQAIPTQFAYIAPPFAGRVVKSYIKLGQQVQANTPLFEISSPDLTTAQKEFYQAQSERELAQKDLQRKQDLIKNGVGSQKELEEAQNILKIADKEYENTLAALKVYQVNPNNMVLGQPLIVRAPISGTVIENNIVTGQYINDDSEPVAIVADLSKVWVVAQVKEKDIPFIHEGENMDIHISATPNEPIKGKVYHIDNSVDEETRSIKVLSVCDNIDNSLKLGMYTTVHFLDKPVESITIPEKALLQDEKNSYVFVQKSNNQFVKVPVEASTAKNGKAMVTKGLQAGDKIIIEGGYYFK